MILNIFGFMDSVWDSECVLTRNKVLVLSSFEGREGFCLGGGEFIFRILENIS